VVPGIRMLLNPRAAIAENVAGTTGGLFQDPSFGVASSVLPRFHPGFRPANAAEAVTGVKAAVQAPAVVDDADVLVLVANEVFVLEVAFEVELEVLADVERVVALLVEVELDVVPVSGIHWEYPYTC
jgi:hypothetical protein